jgi:sterol desaturase/sphingolipid hydroxylase (fatty acid hydroxylase superfamily)
MLNLDEASLRLTVFLGVFLGMACWEVLAPRRKLCVPRARRWLNNLSLTALNTVLLRLMFPLAAVGVATTAASRGWGLLPALDLAFWPSVLLSVLILDLLIWIQHRVMHSVPLLWRLHRVHHADIDFDVTTGSRFHPFEILLSALIKFAAVALLGAPVLAVILFESLLSGMSLFNHANIRLPDSLDRALRRVIVTPEMHRIHHSIRRDETDSNFGFNLSIWDRLFSSYRSTARDDQATMTMGIAGFRDERDVVDLTGLLRMPFSPR